MRSTGAQRDTGREHDRPKPHSVLDATQVMKLRELQVLGDRNSNAPVASAAEPFGSHKISSETLEHWATCCCRRDRFQRLPGALSRLTSPSRPLAAVSGSGPGVPLGVVQLVSSQIRSSSIAQSGRGIPPAEFTACAIPAASGGVGGTTTSVAFVVPEPGGSRSADDRSGGSLSALACVPLVGATAGCRARRARRHAIAAAPGRSPLAKESPARMHHGAPQADGAAAEREPRAEP